jgi:hypothetical protein
MQRNVAINRVFRCHVDEALLKEDGRWMTVLEHGSRVRLVLGRGICHLGGGSLGHGSRMRFVLGRGICHFWGGF